MAKRKRKDEPDPGPDKAEPITAWAIRRVPQGWQWVRLEVPVTSLPMYEVGRGEPDYRTMAVGEIVAHLELEEGAA